MSKQEIINHLAKNQTVEKIINKIDPALHDKEDLINDIYLSLCEKTEAQLQHLIDTNAIGFFIITMCKNNIFSANSPYYRTYGRWHQNRSVLQYEHSEAADE